MIHIDNGRFTIGGVGKLSEETGTGAVAGYATPYAFSKKSGSKRALAATEKMGYKKVKDID